MASGSVFSSQVVWQLLYTKRHAEAWTEVNLRRQGFEVLLPRVRATAGFAPLFPRYVFAGSADPQRLTAFQNTRGVLYVVRCGDQAARVPVSLIADIGARMDAHGVVHLEEMPQRDPLFEKRERERVRALVKFAAAGFRVKAA
jgi:hypothetical protein